MENHEFLILKSSGKYSKSRFEPFWIWIVPNPARDLIRAELTKPNKKASIFSFQKYYQVSFPVSPIICICFDRSWSKWSINFSTSAQWSMKKTLFEKNFFFYFETKWSNCMMIEWSIIKMINYFDSYQLWSINLINDRSIDQNFQLDRHL